MENFPLFQLIIFFLISAAVTLLAGITLAKTTDSIDHRFGLGDALGGLILLGISGSLPEIAVVWSAATHGHIPVIIGTLLGGIAIQTLIIVIFDLAVKGKKPLSYLVGSLELSFETIFAMVITALAVLAAFIPSTRGIFNIHPLSMVIFIAWILGLLVIDKIRNKPRFLQTAEDGLPGRKHKERRKAGTQSFYTGKTTLHIILVFIFASVLTLIAGFVLEESGTAIADKLGIGSGIFAATFIALVTALPEISTGLESIFIGDNHLAISDIMGGNAFMIVLFLLGDIVAGKPVLSSAGQLDISLGILGIVMMSVYTFSFLFKLKKRHFRLGMDSYLEILIYILGIFFFFR
jgi:cation:H+ antiporter